MSEPNIYADLANRLQLAKRGWLPEIGQVVNVTFTETETMFAVQALHEAALRFEKEAATP